jgi:hypothetical protein
VAAFSLANEVNLDQAHLTLPKFALLLTVFLQPFAWKLVGFAQEFDNGHDLSFVRVVDFQKRLGHGIGVKMYRDRFSDFRLRPVRNGDARHGTGTTYVFHDAHVWIKTAHLVHINFEDNAFLDSSDERTGQYLLQLVAGVDYDAGMNVAPVPFQVRIHARKWTFHTQSPRRPPSSIL